MTQRRCFGQNVEDFVFDYSRLQKSLKYGIITYKEKI